MPLNKLPRLRDPEKRDFVHEVRELFMERYKQQPEAYYREDVDQVEKLKFLLQRCIISKRKNVKDSLNMLDSMLKWRKERKIRELSDSDFPLEYHLCGTAFLYEPDKFGNRTLYIRTQLLRTIPELKASFKDYLAYMIYQVDDSVDGETWSVVFDLTNTGWANYDIDLMMHFLTLLREYFPVNLDYVLAINFPWVLSAAWAVAKRFIPPERRDVVVFISQNEIFNYIDEANVPDFLGGSCKRSHQLTPKTSQTTVDYLLSLEEPELSAKRIREIIKAFADILPKDHVASMFKQLELSSRD